MSWRNQRSFDESYGNNPGGYGQPGSSRGYGMPNYVSEDEALARQLQGELDLNDENPDYHASPPQQQNVPLVPTAASGNYPGAHTAGTVSAEDESYPAIDPSKFTEYALDLPNLQAFTQQVCSVGCVQCGKKLLDSSVTPNAVAKPWFEKKRSNSHSALECSQCNATTCMGCGNSVITTGATQDWKLTWCCDGGRLFMLWVLLCLHDQQYIQERARSKQGGGFRAPSISRWTNFMPGSSQEASDRSVTQVTDYLEMLWPGSVENSESRFDHQPPSVLLTMVLNSFVLERIGSLVRNDSIEDVSSRTGVYDKVLSLVGAMGAHPDTAGLVVNERIARDEAQGLLKISFGKGSSSNRGKAKADASPSIATCLENLASQSRILVQNFGARKGKKLLTSQATLDICNGVLHIASILAKYMPATIPTLKHPTTEWEHWQRKNAVLTLSDDTIFAVHGFGRQARSLKHSADKRIGLIVRQIANLGTSLPPGIFIRYATSRPDVWKVLIIGPLNTPYENGCFEFDVFFPGTYPRTPPFFYFVQAGRYRMVINPNLHPDGKVCLSLLNTWSGPQWDPKHSTPLQVLVSIQAMIFCEEPWYNEPGHQRDVERGVTRSDRAQMAVMTYNTR
ncbi:MAG: glycylpeptide N-tetradecanoyltransferase, partial [Bogoriella megaspora]